MTCSRKEKVEILIMRILPLRQSAHHRYTIESQRQNTMRERQGERETKDKKEEKEARRK